MIEKNIALPGNQYCQAVSLVDTSGNSYLANTPTPASSTQASVASSATDVTILAANTERKGCTIYNESIGTLYVLLSTGTSSTTRYSLQIAPNSALILKVGDYSGVIKGLWSAANGFARVTEFF
jgi:hypothetical protein